jgi:ligand-binding sensor domain-containing protein/signal transduction histidine kinase
VSLSNPSHKLNCKRAVFPLLIFFFAASARAERLPLKPYTTADGLAHNEINKIVRDSRGFLWFCTAEGLSRFDGYSFTNYGTDQGLPHAAVNDFLETRSGELWVATNGGLVLFNPKGATNATVAFANDPPQGALRMFTSVVPDDSDRRAKAITVLLETRDGTIWCGTFNGLYRLERTGGGFALNPVEMGMPGDNPEQRYISDFLEDRHGSLWVAAASGLYRRWPDGTAARYTVRDGLPSEYIIDLLEDHRGQLWAGTRGVGFFRFAADATHAPPAVTGAYKEWGAPQVWAYQLFETSDHRFWVASNAGLVEYFTDGDRQGRQFRAYTPRNGLLYHEITALNEDAGGNLWLGSYAGAMKLARSGFVTYDERDGLLSVIAIFGDAAGGVCFRGNVLGDKHKSIFDGAKLDLLRPAEETAHLRYGRLDGQRFTWFVPGVPKIRNVGWVSENITLQARNGEWWLGTGEGLYRFPPTDDFTRIKTARPLAVYQTKEGLTGFQQVVRIFEDSRGDIWAATAAVPNGLARWERASDTFRRDLADSPGLPQPADDLVRSFGEDRSGNVWIGFGTGLARYREGRFTFFDAKDGLRPGGIQNIYTDRRGRLWLASARSGLIRVDDPAAERPAFKSYTTAEGLSSNSAEVITEDLGGYIYVGTGRGLDRLDPETNRVKHFTTADGLASGKIIAAFRDRQGALWFGTSKGLSRFAPGTDTPAQPPPVLITNLHVAGVRQTVSSLGETEVALPDLAADQNQLQIEFVGLSFAPGEVLRYQYRIAGSRADWSTPSEQRTVNLAGLAPGRYEFLVRAVNSDGIASAAPATITFTILHPFWQRWWFMMLVALALSLIAYALYRYRVARILELANVRTRIASDLHDDIGANLTKISILSEVARQKLGNGDAEKDSPLASIARISRESVASMSDIVWAINPRRDSLRDVVRRMRLHAEESCLPREIELVFTAPPGEQDLKLGVDTRRDLYLVFKEAVNNAMRHSACTRLEVELAIERDGLFLRIGDNGIGFDPSLESEGNGLVSMQRRAETLGGKLVAESRAGHGTTVKLRLPYSRSGHFLPT